MDYAGAIKTLDQTTRLTQAGLLRAGINPLNNVLIWTQALDTAQSVNNPLKIGGPHRTLWIAAVTGGATANVQLNSSNPAVTPIPLALGSVIKQSPGNPWSEANFSWTAQAGATMTFVLSLDAEITPGTLLSTVSGTIQQTTGKTPTKTIVAVPNATATKLFAAGASNQQSSFNVSGITMYLGVDNTVDDGAGAAGVNRGLEWPANAPLVWNSQGALWVFQRSGADLTAALKNAPVVITES